MLQVTCSALPAGAYVRVKRGHDTCDAIAYLYLDIETFEVILRLVSPCVYVQLNTRGQELVGPQGMGARGRTHA